MFNYSTESRVESKVAPGVVFVIHAPSYGKAVQLDKATAEFRSLSRMLQRRYQKLNQELQQLRRAHNVTYAVAVAELAEHQKAKPADEEIEAMAAWNAKFQDLIERGAIFRVPDELDEAFQEVNSQSISANAEKYNIPRVRVYLKALEGYEIDGKPADVKAMIEQGAIELFNEALESIDLATSSKADEVKNLSSPSTSSNQADGETTDMIATSASE